ncbi:hypothetical protein BH10ACT6_BH10ACT6_11740 [soil metagenome]
MRSTRGTFAIIAIGVLVLVGLPFAGSAATAAPAGLAPTAADYTFTDLGTEYLPKAVNNAGQVLVQRNAYRATGIFAGVWQNGSVTQLIPVPTDSVIEGANVADITDTGLVIGTADNVPFDGGYHAAYWLTGSGDGTAVSSPAGGVQALQGLYANNSGAVTFSGAYGASVGYAQTAFFASSPSASPVEVGSGFSALTSSADNNAVCGVTSSGAILAQFTRGGSRNQTQYLLPSPGASAAQSVALDVHVDLCAPLYNDGFPMSKNGTIVGGSSSLGANVLRTPDGTETVIPGSVSPSSVNDDGDVVGTVVGAGKLVHGGVVTDLQTLMPNGPTRSNVYPREIDNAGDIIGTYDSSDGSRGFILIHKRGPSASFTSAPASSEPGVLQFVSTSTVPSGDALTEDWDFGDGHTAQGPAVTHAYTSPGTFHVTLKVTNQAGTSSSITHDSVVASPTLTSSVSFVDDVGNPLSSVAPKVGDVVHYKVTLAAGQDGVGDLSHVAFVGDPLTIAVGSPLVDVGAPTPTIPTNVTLHPGDSTSFVYALVVKAAGNIRATTQATATDAGGATVTSGLSQLSFAVGGLKVEISLNPPSYNAEPDENGPKPVDITMTEKITNVTDGRLTGINIRSMDVLRTHVGQLLESTPTLGSNVPDPIDGLPVGSLDPGASVTVSAVFTLKADGHVQFQSLVTAASSTGGTVKGTGSATLAIGVTKVLEFTSRVVNPTGAPLVPAGTPIAITGTVHNLTDSATLDVGPLFATTTGNAGLQSLTYDGVGVSPKAFQVPGALILQPGDTKTFTLKALTSYSEPTNAGGVIPSGGTSATFAFTPWAKVTLDDGTDYLTNEDGSEILSTPEDLTRRVAIDDSIPIPDYGTVQNAAIIGGAIMYGGLEGTWNAASGMVTGLINLPKVSASTLWAVVNFQTKVWESFTPEERDAFAHETSYMIVSVLERNVTLAKEGTPALFKQASDYVENYLTGLENARQTGNWAEVTEIYTSGAANLIGQAVIPIAIGKMATSSQAVTELEAAQAELQAKTAQVVERSNGAVTAEQIVPVLNDLSTGAQLSPSVITKLFGITEAELAEFQALATKYRYLLTVRARSATSIDWIETFNAAVKPEALKIKTVSALDAKLGYAKDKIGTLVFKEPVALQRWKAAGAKSGDIAVFVQRYVEEQGFVPGTEDYYSAIFRVADRIGEWNKWESTYFQWNKEGWMDTTFSWKAQDIIPPEGSGPKYDGFRLVGNADDGYVVELYDETLEEFVPVTGDIDQVAFSHLDGSELTPDEFVNLLDEMRKNPLIQAQHGPAETYTNGGIDFIESQFKPNEPGLQIGPTGIAPRVVRLNTGASRWMSANNKHIVWDGSIVTTGGNPALTAPATVDIDYNAALHLEPTPVQTIRPLPGNGSQGANVGRCRVTYSTSPTAPLLLMNAQGEISQVTGSSLTSSPYQTSCFGSGPIVDLPVRPATVTTSPVTAGTHEVPISSPGPLSATIDPASGFAVGQTVIVDPGTPQAETAVISGFGSIIFRDGLTYDHPAGATIIVASTPAATAVTALAITGNELAGPFAIAMLLLLLGCSARVIARRRREEAGGVGSVHP